MYKRKINFVDVTLNHAQNDCLQTAMNPTNGKTQQSKEGTVRKKIIDTEFSLGQCHDCIPESALKHTRFIRRQPNFYKRVRIESL